MTFANVNYGNFVRLDTGLGDEKEQERKKKLIPDLTSIVMYSGLAS